MARARESLSKLFVPPELADTLPPETRRPSFIGRLLASKKKAEGDAALDTERRPSLEIEIHPDRIAAAEQERLEFRPREEVTLYGDTPVNLDLVDRSDQLETKTDEFEIPPIAIAETPTAPMAPRAGAGWRDRLFFWRAKPLVAAQAAETIVESNPTFLYSKFRAFYNEIIRFRHQRTEFAAGFATALLSEAVTMQENPDIAAESLSRKLTELLELQAAEAKWMGGEMALRYPEAQFAMAALADEVFTHFDWDGRTAWPGYLLEPRLFRTHGAPYELFRRIDKLLKEAPNTPVSRDLARVYLLVIAAGFQGKYRPFGLTRALAEYRQRLYEYIYRDDALMLYAPERTLMPEVAARTLAGQAVSRLSGAQRWAAILVFLMVGYTVVAHLAWSRVSSDLADVTSRIIVDSAAAGGGIR